MSATTTPTAETIWQHLNTATGTAAVIAAARQLIPGNTSVELTTANGAKAWRIRTMCCGTPFTDTRTIGTSARSDLALLAREALNHTDTHGLRVRTTGSATPASGRCEECRKPLTAFDEQASPVGHLCFNCA